MRNSLALFLLVLSTAASAQNLGSMFLTPKERDELDRLRRGEPVAAVGQAERPNPDPVVTGFIKRSDGKSTVFIDRKPYPVRDKRLQERLTPRIVEAYVPPPPPQPGALTLDGKDTASGKNTSSAKEAGNAKNGKTGGKSGPPPGDPIASPRTEKGG